MGEDLWFFARVMSCFFYEPWQAGKVRWLWV
jgi:hypothetical protein